MRRDGIPPEGGGPPPDLRLRRRFFSIPTLVAYVVAIGVLALTASRVFNIDWAETWRLVRSTDPAYYVLALALYYLSFWFRGYRWILIARSAEMDRAPGVRLPSSLTASGIILMGWFANSVAFMRLGDAYRSWAFARESGARFSASLGTVLGERVQDMAAVLLLLFIAAAGIAAGDRFHLSGWVIAGAIVLVGALLALLVAMRFLGDRLARRLPSRLQGSYANFQTGALAGFRPRHLPPQMALGAVGWLLEAGRLYLVAKGMGLEIDFWAAMFAALASAMLTTIPTPGGFGFVEGGLTGVLIILGFNHTDAFSLTLVDRTISWISIIVIGGALFLAWQVLRGRRASPPHGSPAPAAPPGGPHEESP